MARIAGRRAARGRPVGQPGPTVRVSNCRKIAQTHRDRVTPADVDTPFLSTSAGGISEYEDRKTDTSGPLLTLDDQDGRVGVFHELNVAKDE